MGLFSWLTGRKTASPEAVAAQESIVDTLPEIKEEDFVDNSEPESANQSLSNEIYRVSYGTGFPIDVIYGFINRDFEQKGYDDAMVNTSISYKESGKQLIINELKSLFQQVTLRYQRDKMGIEVMIENLEGQGLPLQVKALRMRLQLLDDHIKKIVDMQTALDKKEESVMRMVITYERGFLKGLAAKSDFILQNNGQKIENNYGEV